MYVSVNDWGSCYVVRPCALLICMVMRGLICHGKWSTCSSDYTLGCHQIAKIIVPSWITKGVEGVALPAPPSHLRQSFKLFGNGEVWLSHD